MNEPDLYNLALGDLDPKTGEIDFEIKTNNGDRNIILATICETINAFLYNRQQCSNQLLFLPAAQLLAWFAGWI